jgi:hypothetical protein
MTHGRRLCLMIALGAALTVLAAAINALLRDSPDGGWFMYAPNSNTLLTSNPGGRGVVLRESAVWLAAIGLWLAIAWRVFKSSGE